MDALNRTVATVHVIKLHLLGITLDDTQHLIVRTSEIYYATHYLSPHREDERLFIRIGIEANLLGESTHLLGIVYRLDDETFAGSNARLRIINLRTAAAFNTLLITKGLCPSFFSTNSAVTGLRNTTCPQSTTSCWVVIFCADAGSANSAESIHIFIRFILFYLNYQSINY